ncbi:MAG: hypothetical protein V1709_08560 [Planctomycetota bacterium]
MLNNPEGTVEAPEEVIETNPADESTENQDGNQPADTKPEGEIEAISFMPKEDQERWKAEIERNPAMKPAYDQLIESYKGMQSNYTKKTQTLAAERKAMEAIQKKAALYDKAISEGLFNPATKKQPGAEENPAQTAVSDPKAAMDILKKQFPDMEEDELMWFENRLPALMQIFGNKAEIDALRGTVDNFSEAKAKAELQSKFPDVALDAGKDDQGDYEGYWEDCKAIKRDNPKLTWEQALVLAAGENWNAYLREKGKAEALKDTNSANKGKKVMTLGGKTTSKKSGYTRAEIDEMSHEDYEKKGFPEPID